MEFEQWWKDVGLKEMPGVDEPPEHGYIAQLAWNAAIKKGETQPDEIGQVEAVVRQRIDIAKKIIKKYVSGHKMEPGDDLDCFLMELFIVLDNATEDELNKYYLVA